MSTASRILRVGEEPPPLEGPGERLTASERPTKAKRPKRKAGDRFVILNAFVDFTLRALTRAELATWLVLYRDTRDGTARTSITDVARRTGCNRSTIFRALQSLKEKKLLRVVHRGGLGKGLSIYRVRALGP